MKCIICNSKLNLLFDKFILGKYKIKYYQCKKCEYFSTEKPFWLKEAYSSAIADADTGLLSRNTSLSKITACLIYFLFNKTEKHLDYAGGYGVFTRLMRDIGFNYYWDDPMSENIFAKSFKSKKKEKYQIVTAFEYLEHIQDPVKEISRIFENYGNDAFIFSTYLYKEPIRKDWWYFAPETGQHISFYKTSTLEYIANKLNLNLYSNGKNIHMLSKRKIPNIIFLLLTNLWPILYLWVNKSMKSKTFSDHKMILSKK